MQIIQIISILSVVWFSFGIRNNIIWNLAEQIHIVFEHKAFEQKVNFLVVLAGAVVHLKKYDFIVTFLT